MIALVLHKRVANLVLRPTPKRAHHRLDNTHVELPVHLAHLSNSEQVFSLPVLFGLFSLIRAVELRLVLVCVLVIHTVVKVQVIILLVLAVRCSGLWPKFERFRRLLVKVEHKGEVLELLCLPQSVERTKYD